MKKLLLTFIAIAGIIGCSGEITIESKPNKQPKPTPPPRIVWGESANNRIGPYINIIKDNENDVEYLCVRDGHGIVICPIIKKEVTAEKNNNEKNHESP